jgi:hypothetical protein
MRPCCPPGEGCNSRSGMEPCALSELRHDARPEAEQALGLWERYTRAAGSSRSNRRFLRRAYARARDRALGLWTPWRGSGLGRA